MAEGEKLGRRGAQRKLTTEQQHFIVTQLACYVSIVDIQGEFEKTYGEKIDRNLVGRYDPTRAYSRSLAQKLVELFNATRKAYEEGLLGLHPISKRTFRVERLGRMFEKTYDKGNIPLAASLLKQAADEMAEMPGAKQAAARGKQNDQAPESDGFDGSEVELGNLREVLTDAIGRALGKTSATTVQ